MGNKIIFSLIGLFLGGMGGFFVGGAVCAKQYKKTIEQLQMEKEALASENKKMAEKAVSDREKAVKKAEVKYRVDKIIKKEGYSEENDLVEDDEDDEAEFDSDDEVDFDDPFETSGKNDESKAKGFTVLTEREYAEDSSYATRSEALTYYQQDGILADAFDEPLENGTNVIGAEAMNKIQKTDDQFVYVMDNEEDILYEVEVNHIESFYRDAQI